MTAWTGDRSLEVVTFGLDGETFALDAARVREILDVIPVTEVPGSHPFVSGLINVRGKVVPLADLRLKFGMPVRPPTVDTRLLIVEIDIDGDPTMVGIRADKVYEVTELAPAALEETPRLGMTWPPEFIRCIGKRGDDFIVVLDIDRVFAVDAAHQPASDEVRPERQPALAATARSLGD